jgi:hypothetical protein
MYFVIAHGVSYLVAILCSIILWPQLSGRQFITEYRYCMELCRELFLVLSLKLDTEVIIHEQDHESDSVSLLKQKKNATDKQIRHLENQYPLCIFYYLRFLK